MTGLLAYSFRWGIIPQVFGDFEHGLRITLELSILSLVLSLALGLVVALCRMSPIALLRWLAYVYTQLFRAISLYIYVLWIYFGLASAVGINLSPLTAGVIALTVLNSAYMSEIYRSALEAVSIGQIEAARTLGLSERQVLRLVRGPQAFRLALAPMTNDFVALLKDSSLVSVLTVLELTKETQIFATNLGSWVIPGTMCAALYLAMSLPLAAAARRLERRWRFS